jgi:hypothetical protein
LLRLEFISGQEHIRRRRAEYARAQGIETTYAGLIAGYSVQERYRKKELAMTQDQQGEPPSWFRQPPFMVGQDRSGNWVVQDQKGMRGGLFVNREAAFRYVRSENGFKPQPVVMVSGGFELDMSRNGSGLRLVESASDLANRRRIA